jgi:transposase
LKLVNQLGSEKNRLQKVLDDAGIRLGGIVSDIDGVSAQAIIQGLIQQHSLEQLVECARGRLKIKRATLRLVLDEPLSDRHRFLLQQIHHHMAFLKQQITLLEGQLLDSMSSYRQAWQHLQTLPGIDELSAAMIIAEVGIDMSRFGSAERLASWAGLCPGQNESAGKRKSTRTRRGNRTLRQVLCEAAQAASKTRSQFKGKYQTLVVRRGHKRTIIAIAHKLLRIIYFVLERQQPYRDPEIDYEALMVQKNAPRWLKKLKQYGYL